MKKDVIFKLWSIYVFIDLLKMNNDRQEMDIERSFITDSVPKCPYLLGLDQTEDQEFIQVS